MPLRAALAVALALAAAPAAPAATVQISADPYKAPIPGQHRTEVEPDSFAAGQTIVAAFQVGRTEEAGAANNGFAVSDDAGATWTDGVLPGITTVGGGPHARVSDPAVAYDPKRDVWLIASLALGDAPNYRGDAIVVNRSTDGGKTWGPPVDVAVASGSSDFDKNWIACDTTPTSPHYGNCYVQWDDFGQGSRLLMSTSTDGGLTWGAPKQTAGGARGLGGQPVVRPNGTVVVPYESPTETAMRSFRSTNGGASWSAPVGVSPIFHRPTPGQIRAGPLPSAEVDGAGRVYVAWEDCRFHSGCSANDIVISSSDDGVDGTAPRRVPLASVAGGAHHFVPGLGVDRATRGTGAHLGLAYHQMPRTDCGPSTCPVWVGFVNSLDGGRTWSAPRTLAGPMTPTDMASTSQGYMTGDYISTSFAAGRPHPVFAVARPRTGALFREAIYAADPPLLLPRAARRKLTELRIAPERFRAKRRGPSIVSKGGARVTYRASGRGRTRFRVRRGVRRSGPECGPPRADGSPRTCRRWVLVKGSFRRTDVRGENSFRFSGRLDGRLRAARYRLVAQPRWDGRGAGKSVFVPFTILKPAQG